MSYKQLPDDEEVTLCIITPNDFQIFEFNLNDYLNLQKMLSKSNDPRGTIIRKMPSNNSFVQVLIQAFREFRLIENKNFIPVLVELLINNDAKVGKIIFTITPNENGCEEKAKDIKFPIKFPISISVYSINDRRHKILHFSNPIQFKKTITNYMILCLLRTRTFL